MGKLTKNTVNRKLTRLSRVELLSLKRQYLMAEVPDNDICARFGIAPTELRSFVTDRGWAELRDNMWRKHEVLVDHASEDHIAALKRSHNDFIESVKVQSEELTEKGFDFARNATEAKTFEMAMRGTKTSVELFRQAAGLDAVESAGAGTPVLAVFQAGFGPIGQAPSQPLNEKTPETDEDSGVVDDGDDLI